MTTWSNAPLKSRFYSPTETETGCYLLQDLHLKKIVLRSLRKAFLCCKAGKEAYLAFKKVCVILKGPEKEFTTIEFLM